MRIVRLSEIDAGMAGLAGGKAAGLGELIRAGERVPGGFCLTTEAYASGELPAEELAAAYETLGAGPVAVRSSANAEDLPDASFAGQQDTYLGVRGTDELAGAVRRCWASLHTERAIAYRKANGIDEDAVRMAVVVQRMVDAEVAGVLFTANPVTGNRGEMAVDAAPGLGTAVVDGTVVPDHYVLSGPPESADGCLTPDRLAELYAAGARVQEHFGSPQDIEWAYDADGTLWLLQSRPVTTLFPLPPDTGKPLTRVFLNIGPFQGMHRPFTPMGVSLMRMASAKVMNAFGGSADPLRGPAGFTEIAGHVFVDWTRRPRSWRRGSTRGRCRTWGSASSSPATGTARPGRSTSACPAGRRTRRRSSRRSRTTCAWMTRSRPRTGGSPPPPRPPRPPWTR